MAEDATTATQGDTNVADAATPAETQPVVETPAVAEAPAQTEETVAEAPAKEGGLLSKVEDSGDVVPETYEFEGLDSLDAKSLEDIQAFAKENKLTNAQAQMSANAVKSYQDGLIADNQAFAAEQAKVFEADPKGAENLLLAEKGLKQIGALDSFKAAGHDNDYSLVKIAAELGRMFSEAKTVTGAETAPHGPQNPYSKSPEFNK